jgi:hypothetical protein
MTSAIAAAKIGRVMKKREKRMVFSSAQSERERMGVLAGE